MPRGTRAPYTAPARGNPGGRGAFAANRTGPPPRMLGPMSPSPVLSSRALPLPPRASALAALLAAALPLGCAGPSGGDGQPEPAGQKSRPNVVLVYVDDLGAGELGCYGQEKIRTPHIDSIASAGVRFTDAYSGSPVCAPSRCIALTGKHSGHAVVRGNWENGGWGPDQPEGQYPLPDAEVTLAERLQDLGYRTAGYGKWGLGGPGTEGAPEKQGFDHFYGYLCQRKAHNYYPTHLWNDGERAPIDGNEYFRAHQKLKDPLAGPDEYYAAYGDGSEGYAPQLIADDMIDWLSTSAESGEPFFLYYASIIPHLALQVPREYVDRYPAEWDPEPYLGGNGYLPHASPRRAYAGMISFLDDQVGRILDTLEEHGLAEDTIVLFTSDNGASYVGGMDAAFFASHDGRRGHKGQVFEGGIRVPLVARWPGRFTAGATSSVPVSSVDLTATVMDLVDSPLSTAAADGLDSWSFAEVLERPNTWSGQRPFLYWEFKPHGAQAVREGPWKLVRTGLKQGSPKDALYNLVDDPAETTNLLETHADVAARLALLMDTSHEANEVFPLPHVDEPAAPRKRKGSGR